jgi:hypothetical protein
MRIVTFLLFLCAYVLWIWAATKMTKQLTRPTMRGARMFWATESFGLLSNIGFFVLIYLISGFWNWRMLVLFLIASQLGIIVGWLLNALLGSQSEQSYPRIMAAGGEIGLTYPRITLSLVGVSALVTLAYVVAGGIIHFRYPWNSPELHIAAVKYTLIFLIFGNYPAMMAEVAAMLASENLDESTRQQIFINQLAGMIPTALFVALALWAFGAGGAEVPATFANVSKVFSIRVTLLMVGFFFLLFILPYFIGTQRANRKRTKLLERKRDLTGRLADLLESPVATKYAPGIAQLRSEIGSEWQALTTSSGVFALAQDPNPSEETKAIAAAVNESRSLDPRFQHADGLAAFDAELVEINDDLQAQPPGTVVAAAERWSKKYENRKAELSTNITTTHNAKPLVTAALGMVVSALVSSILSGVGSAAWGAISGGAVHK